MNEAQAWREIARRYAEGIDADYGLWWHIFILHGQGWIDKTTRLSMLNHFDWHCKGNLYKRANWEWQGGLVALWLAMEAAE